MMSYFFPPATEKRYVDCVLCKRFVSVGNTELLFMDGKIKMSMLKNLESLKIIYC